MGNETKANPRQRISLGAPFALSDFAKHGVVVSRMIPDVFLNARKLGRNYSLSHQNERLQRACHPAIPIFERMDHG